ncbi:uncharacterized protein [Argopecten irradians]|uniref:uncharacterized protein n=1 Tax=Argopecten irradians TaxID=31199 RepID=UPI003722F0D0
MNWVGGARNRLRFSNEKKIQKEFFERRKFDGKTGNRHKIIPSGKKHSEDLKAIHTISTMHSDSFSFQQPCRPLKMLDLDKFRSKKSVFRGDIDLGPTSPIKTPSKLHLLEASHQKQVARKVTKSPFEDALFFPKSSQNRCRSYSSDDESSSLQMSEYSNSQTKFKIPDIPRKTQTPISEADCGRVWNRKLNDEMFRHSSLPKKVHTTVKFEPYNQSSRRIKHQDFDSDLFDMNLKQGHSKTLDNSDKDIPVIPFVSKPINSTEKNMFITEDFQMTPIRKYQGEDNAIPKVGSNHLSRNVDLSDLSDGDNLAGTRMRSNVFQGEDFLQTPLTNKSPSDDLFESSQRFTFSNPDTSQRVKDQNTFEENLSPAKVDQDKTSNRGMYLNEAIFQTPLYKFTPKKQLQPVVSNDETHDKHSTRQSSHGVANKLNMPARSQGSFITTLSDFRDSMADQSFNSERMTISETALFPETIRMQVSPTESASLNIGEIQAQKVEEYEENHLTGGKRSSMTEILDEMQALEKQDKMDEWMLSDELPHQKESFLDQDEEEEIMFQSDAEEVKNIMNDMLTRVVADCSDDFDFDRCDSSMETQYSIPSVQSTDSTLEGSNLQDESNKINIPELLITDSDNDVTEETRFRDASTSTEKETCDKGTQYSPKMVHETVPLHSMLSSCSQLHPQFSVTPFQLGEKMDKDGNSCLESGVGTLNSENAYCLRSRKKI